MRANDHYEKPQRFKKHKVYNKRQNSRSQVLWCLCNSIIYGEILLLMKETFNNTSEYNPFRYPDKSYGKYSWSTWFIRKMKNSRKNKTFQIILCLINDKEKSELTPTVNAWELRDTFTGAVEGSKLSIILPCKPNLVYQNRSFSVSWIAYSRYC